MPLKVQKQMQSIPALALQRQTDNKSEGKDKSLITKNEVNCRL